VRCHPLRGYWSAQENRCLPLHRLPAPIWKCLWHDIGRRRNRFPTDQGRGQDLWLALRGGSAKARRILPGLRMSDLPPNGMAQGHGIGKAGNARRHKLAKPGYAFVDAQQAVVGHHPGRRGVARDAAFLRLPECKKQTVRRDRPRRLTDAQARRAVKQRCADVETLGADGRCCANKRHPCLQFSRSHKNQICSGQVRERSARRSRVRFASSAISRTISPAG